MPFIEWNDSLDVKVKAMNDEHKELIRLMNDLYDKVEAKANKEILTKSLVALKEYTIKHFEDEEKYMESIDFAELKTHKNIHKALLDKLAGFEEKFLTTGGIGQDFFDFLSFWLRSHIKGIDTKYSNA